MHNSFSKKFSEIKLIDFSLIEDSRGYFIKSFSKKSYENFRVSEVFCSVSHKNTIRGMHLQKKPYELKKIVTCIDGEILDVVIDLRKDSDTFGEIDEFKLTKKEGSIYIPEGFGHGFSVLSETATILYIQDGEYKSEYEIGVNPLSLDYDWQVEDPIVSDKDSNLPSIKHF